MGKLNSLKTTLLIKLKEKCFNSVLPYLFYKNNSKKLIIVFSAFSGNTRRYNYVKGLRQIDADRLYILDPFGVKGSYNLYENGLAKPREYTLKLINQIISSGNYSETYTMGSSKGGTCAIYFGLQINATAIFAGACQYNLGSYVHRPDHEEIFLGMMGKNAGDKEAALLNSIMPNILKNNRDCKSVVHVLYSKKELTYERQIIDLLRDLRENNIPTVEIEDFFDNHEDVGRPFLNYLLKYFC